MMFFAHGITLIKAFRNHLASRVTKYSSANQMCLESL